jgi:hypothetical protein
MAKGSRNRAMPSTPAPRAEQPAEEQPVSAAAPVAAAGPRAQDRASAAAPAAARPEPAYLLAGTDCVAGHARGHELESPGIGRTPTRKAARTGFALVLWCTIGVAFLVDRKWLAIGIQALVLWLVFSAFVQRRAGHRKRCWRTRTWRHAWGGLVPTGGDPTRPAGT